MQVFDNFANATKEGILFDADVFNNGLKRGAYVGQFFQVFPSEHFIFSDSIG